MASYSAVSEPVDADSSSSSSSAAASSSRKSKSKRFLSRKEENRIIAACCGALITSLTMTPFDVVKTRLQTQGSPESMFVPSSHVPPPSVHPHQSASSRLKGKGKAIPTPQPAAALQHARSLAATNLATCCQKTYFTTNLAEKKEILCRFDPREALEAGRTAITGHSSAPILRGSAGVGTLVLDGAEACLYPSPSIAAERLPQMSAPSSRHFAGFFDAVTKIARYEGLPALWRGLTPSLVMSVPSQVIYMVGYDTLRTEALAKAPRRYRSTRTGQPTSTYIATTTFVAGSLSRTAVAALLAPLELFRTRLQSTGSHVSLANVVGSVRDLARSEGIGSLWRGLSATLWRDVPFSGAYWAGYEAIRRVLSGGLGMGEISAGDNASRTFGIAFASGAGSGMIASFLTHPFDVAKTRRQVESSSTHDRSTLTILKEIGAMEGTRGLWRGMAPRVAKVAPACGIMIGAYEIGLRWTGEAD